MPSASQMLPEIGPNNLRISTEKLSVVRDDETNQVERDYLTIHGTPQAYRWLAKLLHEMADSAEDSEASSGGHSVLIDPADLQQISLERWSSLSLDCRRQLEPLE